MELTNPLTNEELQAAFPRDTRAMAAAELTALLRIEERALRSQYAVSAATADADETLKDAMLAAWPSFVQQVRQVAIEDVSADGASVTYNRAGVIDFTFPSFIAAILAPIADADNQAAGALATELVR